MNGQKIKEIQNSNEYTYFIDIYYDHILSKIYIVTGNTGFSQSYDYNNNEIYHTYHNNTNVLMPIYSLIIKNLNRILI